MASGYVYVPTERDPKLSTDDARARGRQMIQWIEHPAVTDPPCPTTVNTLTYQQVQQEARNLSRNGNCVLSGLRPFPLEVQAPKDYIRHLVSFGEDKYTMYFASGIIVLYAIHRAYNSTSPHPTDLALTLYQQEFGGTDTLRHIFASTVVNTQTVAFIEQDLEARSLAQFGAPYMITDYTYMYGTPEYEAFLGVRIPRTMGYIVLGAFPRGTHRIARLAVCSTGFGDDIRCDIEPIA